MAVKASTTITLYYLIDIVSTTVYYLLQPSTSSPPSKPTTDNPGGNWTTSEPTYSEGSTNTLYTVTKFKYSRNLPDKTVDFEYTPVSKSTSYEAAKAAYNKAVNAQTTATNITDRVNDKENNYNYKYHTNVVVYGDVDKFYPVMIKAGNQDIKRTIMIKRGYHEQAPQEWNKSTHQGSLALRILCNFGGWGGANYSWEIAEFEEMYAQQFGGAIWTGQYTEFAIFLRGGGETGALYHLYSDQSLTNVGSYHYGWDESLQKYKANVLPCPQIAYNSDLNFGYPGNKPQNPAGSGYYDDLQYKYYAPAPKAMVASGTTDGGFTKYVRTDSQNEEIRIRQYSKKVVKSTSTQYYSSTSSLTATGGSWVDSLPSLLDNKYLWIRQKILYADGTATYGNGVCVDTKSGGRNLLIGTATVTGDVTNGNGTLVSVTDLFECEAGATTTSAWSGQYINLKDVYNRGSFKVGDMLTLSVYVKSDTNVSKTFCLYRASSASQNDSSKTITLTTNWQRIYFNFVATDYSKTVRLTRIECTTAMDSGNLLYWAGWKLEKGNSPTDWTPAPEDVDSQISGVIGQIDKAKSDLSKEIDSKTGNVQSNVDNINNHFNDRVLDMIRNTDDSSFVLTTSQPDSWSTNYKNYYRYDESSHQYIRIDDDTVPTWSANTFYGCNKTLLQMVQTISDGRFDLKWSSDATQEQLRDSVQNIIGMDNINTLKYISAKDGVMLFGDKSSPYKLLIDNDGVDILYQNNRMSFWDTQKFDVGSLSIGNRDGVWRETIYDLYTGTFTALTSQPSGWATNYTNYYKKSTEYMYKNTQSVYYKVAGSSAPTFVSGEFYSASGTPSVVATKYKYYRFMYQPNTNGSLSFRKVETYVIEEVAS